MKKIPLNYLTLKFNSEKLEQQYKRTSVKQSLKMIRSAIILGCLLFPIFGILDIWMVPERLWSVWEIRIALVIVMLAMYFLSFRLFFRSHAQTLMSILTIIMGVGIINMVLISESEGGYFYYAGLMLVIQFAHGLTRLRFINATLSSLFIALAYLVIAWGIKSTPREVIINNSFFLFATVIISMFISYSLEFYMRANFWQRKILSHQENLLKTEHDRKTKELENVRQLQLSMLPQVILPHPTIELAVSFKTAVEVGGDYYDYHMDENKRISFAIGDATGHGAQAGALVTASKILFSCWSENEDLLTFVNRTSRVIKQMGLPQLFMAMVAGRIENNRLELAGGGLPPALVHRANSRIIEEIPLKGFPLGCVTNYSYKKIYVELNHGDLLLFMTDGFPELFNSNKDMLGMEKIKQVFKEVVDEKLPVVTEHLNKTVENWRNGFPLQDDLTFLVFKVKNNLKIN